MAIFEDTQLVKQVDGEIITTSPIDEGLSQFVLVRTVNAGVHVGIESSIDGNVVTLDQSRRIHYWSGACSCSEIALHGIKNLDNSRIAVILSTITLRDWIEIIPMTIEAAKNVMEAPVWEIANIG